MKIGIISDTHGLVRPDALAALEGTDLIIHAGDVGSPAVLEELRAIAPVVAVRGNCDRGEWADILPENEVVQVESALIYVVHDLQTLGLDAASAGIAAVVSGHSHEPALFRKGGVIYLNPGSAGPRRFRLPVAVAQMRIESGHIAAEVMMLEQVT